MRAREDGLESVRMAVTFQSVSPVLPVRSVQRALAHYRKLGFQAKAYGENAGGDPVYGFVDAGRVELHVARVESLDPKANTSACYLYVDDAEALYASWIASGAEGRFEPPCDTPYGLREIVHVDPDGNLLRVGSPMR
jgi:hypothetical protein